MSATALLVQLNIKTWSARKLDKTATKFVNENFKASEDAGRYNKLLIDPAYLKPITNAISRLREFHYKNTLAANGFAVLPSANYFDYVSGLDPLIEDFNKAAKEFTDKYDQIKQEAALRLQNLYNPNDYPISCHFEVTTTFLPIPENDDWKKLLNIQDDSITTMLDQAVDDLRNRLRETISVVHERLESGGIFRQALIDRCKTDIELVPKLNFTHDEEINQLVTELADTIQYYEAEDIRKDPVLRQQMTKRLFSSSLRVRCAMLTCRIHYQ